jgi:hypothetical protein
VTGTFYFAGRGEFQLTRLPDGVVVLSIRGAAYLFGSKGDAVRYFEAGPIADRHLPAPEVRSAVLLVLGGLD